MMWMKSDRRFRLPMVVCAAGCALAVGVSGAWGQAEEAPKAEEKFESVQMTVKNVDGEETVELWVDGEKIDVDTVEEANEFLRQNGYGGMVMGFGDDEAGFTFELGPEFHDRFLRLRELHDLEGLGHLGHLDRMMRWEMGEGPQRFMWEGPQGGMWQFEGPGGPAAPAQPAVMPKAMLGVGLAPVAEGLTMFLGLEEGVGVQVTAVVSDSPAEAAGLKAGDLIIAAAPADGEKRDVNEASLRKLIAEAEPGSEIVLFVRRAEGEETVTATLGEFKAEALGGLMAPRAGEEGGVVIRRPWGVAPGAPRPDAPVAPRLGPGDEHIRRMMEEMDRQMEEMRRMMEELRRQQEDARQERPAANEV